MSELQAKIIVNKYVDSLRKQGIPVTSAYLFGSRVNGTAYEHSDIDVAIISPWYDSRSDEKRFALWKMRRSIHSLIEPHGFTPEDFENENDPLVHEIRTTGIQVV